jgi:hypothetical protein
MKLKKMKKQKQKAHGCAWPNAPLTYLIFFF